MKPIGTHAFAILTAAAAQTTFAAAPDAPSHDEVRAIVAEMLADAETRSSLLATGDAAGHDGKNFFLASADGNFKLIVTGQVQFRYTANFRDAEEADPPDFEGTDDYEGSFTNPRTKIFFKGHVFEPSLLYQVNGDFGRDGQFRLQDMYFGYDFGGGWTVFAGQYRMPVLWEDMVKEMYSLAADESVVNVIFGQDRSQGVLAQYQGDELRFWLGFGDGLRSANTDLEQDTADWAFTGRGEFKFAGDWTTFGRFTSARAGDFAGKAGLAAHYQGSENEPSSIDSKLLAYTADVMLKGDGWNAFAAFVGQNTDVDGGATNDDFGIVAQGGIHLSDEVELFGRYDVVIPDSGRAQDDNFSTLTAGFNYYLYGNAAKFTLDAQYFFDATTDNELVTANINNGRLKRIGLLPSGEDGQVAIRAQFQILW